MSLDLGVVNAMYDRGSRSTIRGINFTIRGGLVREFANWFANPWIGSPIRGLVHESVHLAVFFSPNPEVARSNKVHSVLQCLALTDATHCS